MNKEKNKLPYYLNNGLKNDKNAIKILKTFLIKKIISKVILYNSDNDLSYKEIINYSIPFNEFSEINPTFDVPELDHPYKFYPQDGDCNGDLNNLLSTISDKPTRHPSFFYNVGKGQKSCLHEGPTGSLYGCSARRDGKW